MKHPKTMLYYIKIYIVQSLLLLSFRDTNASLSLFTVKGSASIKLSTFS